jgi:hypothetical protein
VKRLAAILGLMVGLGLWPPAARADMAPRFLRRNISPLLRFDNLADYPGYTFYLKYGRGYEIGYVTEVTSGVPVHLEGEGDRIFEVVLLAVPHGQSRPARLLDDEEWEKEVGALRSAPLAWRENYITPYRIEIKDGKLETTVLPAEFVVSDWLWGNACFFLVPLSLCLVFVWLGWRTVRRLRPAPNPPSGWPRR